MGDHLLLGAIIGFTVIALVIILYVGGKIFSFLKQYWVWLLLALGSAAVIATVLFVPTIGGSVASGLGVIPAMFAMIGAGLLAAVGYTVAGFWWLVGNSWLTAEQVAAVGFWATVLGLALFILLYASSRKRTAYTALALIAFAWVVYWAYPYSPCFSQQCKDERTVVANIKAAEEAARAEQQRKAANEANRRQCRTSRVQVYLRQGEKISNPDPQNCDFVYALASNASTVEIRDVREKLVTPSQKTGYTSDTIATITALTDGASVHYMFCPSGLSPTDGGWICKTPSVVQGFSHVLFGVR